MAVKINAGKLIVRPSYDRFIRTAVRGVCFRLLSIKLKRTNFITTLPLHHRDSFDRMLIAHAISEDVSIVSADVAFDAYPIRRLW